MSRSSIKRILNHTSKKFHFMHFDTKSYPITILQSQENSDRGHGSLNTSIYVLTRTHSIKISSLIQIENYNGNHMNKFLCEGLKLVWQPIAFRYF